MAVLTILTAMLGSAFYYKSLVGYALKDAQMENEVQSITARNFIQSFFSENVKSVRILAGLKEIKAVCENSSSENLVQTNALLDHFNSSLKSDVCYLLNQEGVAIASSNRNDAQSFIGIDYSFRPYFYNAMSEKPDIYFALGVTSKKRGFYFSHPVYCSNGGAPVGVAVIKISIDIFEQNLRDLKLADTENSLLTNPEGVIISSDKPDWLYRFLWEKDRDNVSDAGDTEMIGRDPAAWSGLKKINEKVARNDTGQKYLYYLMPIPELSGWHIVHLRNLESLYQRLISPFFDVAGFLIVAIAILIGASVLFLYQKASADIERRKRLEKKLSQLSQAVEQSPVSVVITDINGCIEYVNPKFTDITGYSYDEVRGKNPKVLQSGKMPKTYYKKLWDTISAGRTWKGEFINVRKNGEEFWEKASISPLKNHAGQITHFIGVKEDISKLKKADRRIRNSLKFLQLLIDVIPAPVYYKDRNGKYLGCNEAFESFLGMKKTDIIGKTVYDIVPKKLADKYYQKDHELYENPGIQVYDAKVKHADGTFHDVFFNKATFTNDSDSDVGGLVGVMLDITERKQIAQALLESEERFRQLYETAPIAYCSIAPHDSSIIHCNDASVNLLGYSKKDLAGKKVFDLCSESAKGKQKSKEIFGQLMKGQKIRDAEIEMVKENGEIIITQISGDPVLDIEGNLVEGRWMIVDITERKKIEETIRYIALHDNLTGLPNRNLFFDRLEHAIQNADRNRTMVALLYFDLDGFKPVNDKLGHEAGDYVLKETGSRLRKIIRATDTVARIGGDEFAIILPEIKDREHAAAVSMKIIQSVSQPIDVNNQNVSVGASIGISLYPEDAADAEELVQKADIAMYQVKKTGKGSCQFYAPEEDQPDFS
jgi:diguanylate cyclase (GGDEF)-like protein/PAS domain S-box-containing protein